MIFNGDLIFLSDRLHAKLSEEKSENTVNFDTSSTVHPYLRYIYYKINLMFKTVKKNSEGNMMRHSRAL